MDPGEVSDCSVSSLDWEDESEEDIDSDEESEDEDDDTSVNTAHKHGSGSRGRSPKYHGIIRSRIKDDRKRKLDSVSPDSARGQRVTVKVRPFFLSLSLCLSLSLSLSVSLSLSLRLCLSLSAPLSVMMLLSLRDSSADCRTFLCFLTFFCFLFFVLCQADTTYQLLPVPHHNNSELSNGKFTVVEPRFTPYPIDVVKPWKCL